MASVSENITMIFEQAEVLDGLVEQFRAARALIDAAEVEIVKAQPSANHPMHDGRVRLALLAHAKMVAPAGGQTIAEFAANAWDQVQ